MATARNKYIEINGMDWMTPHSGKFTPINPGKYMGNPKNIIFRSSWEATFFRRCDTDPNIISWGSEEIVVPYHDRATGKLRRYFPDVIIKKRGPDGTIEVIMIEIKPYAQSVPPTKGKSEKRYLQECKTFATNYSKWESATKFCERKGWKFIILTERELGIGSR